MTPVLTATPGQPPTYNPGMAETFSWIPVDDADRPLFARATYSVGGSVPGMNIPSHDYILNTYHGTTNNIATVTYKLAGVTVATLTMTYVGGVPSADDARLESVTRS